MRILALLIPFALFAAPAFAQDDLDDIPNYGEDDDDDEDLPTLDEDDGDEDGDPDDEPIDEGIDPGGEDTAEIFSARFEEIKLLSAEERASAWDAYLLQYPNSVYKARIEDLQQQALDDLYDEDIAIRGEGRVDKRSILLTESALLDNMNPATRVKFGFDWGLPAWINLVGDVEYAFNPNLSVHGGLRKRYSGWSVETGTRVAFLKSEKLQTIASFLGDARVNVDPAFLAFRPQLAVGTKLAERVDLQAQGGVELASGGGVWTQTFMAGSNLSVRASRGVAIYAEGLFHAKYLAWPSGTFRFHVVGFGMKFFPGQKGLEKAEDQMEMTLGASLPWSYFPIPNWEFHQGSVAGQASFYLDE